MLEATVDYLGSVQFEVKARKHTVISDQPEDNGGFDEGTEERERGEARHGLIVSRNYSGGKYGDGT